MELYLQHNPKGKHTQNGEMYYEEFRTKFWKKPGKYHCIFSFQILYEFDM
jgi:hypothetical protein